MKKWKRRTICPILALALSGIPVCGAMAGDVHFGTKPEELPEEQAETVSDYAGRCLELLKEKLREQQEARKDSGTNPAYAEILHTVVYLLPETIKEENLQSFYEDQKALVQFTLLTDYWGDGTYMSDSAAGCFYIDAQDEPVLGGNIFKTIHANLGGESRALPEGTITVNLQDAYNQVIE